MCHDSLDLTVFKETPITISEEHIKVGKKQGIYNSDFNMFVHSGLLLCHKCQNRFPIVDGLPVLLPYTTVIHDKFSETLE